MCPHVVQLHVAPNHKALLVFRFFFSTHMLHMHLYWTCFKIHDGVIARVNQILNLELHFYIMNYVPLKRIAQRLIVKIHQ